MNILVLDDEKEIADLVEVYLKNEDYNVFKFYDAKEAIKCIESQELDFAILDVMIKDIDGFSICKMIRDKGLNFPIIMLTAKIADNDKIQGLALGADDYITKPFSLMVLRARIDKVLRKSHTSAISIYTNDIYSFDFDEMAFSENGTPIELSKTEQKLLKLLIQNKNQTLTREFLVDRI